MKTLLNPRKTVKQEKYISPDIMSMNIEFDQNILQNGSDVRGTTEDLKYDDGWW